MLESVKKTHAKNQSKNQLKKRLDKFYLAVFFVYHLSFIIERYDVVLVLIV